MSRQSILVVDDSPALRETVGVLLAGEYAVRCIAPRELDHGTEPVDLVVAAPSLRPRLPEALRATPFLAITEGTTGLPRRFTPLQLRRAVSAALRQPTAGAASAN